MFIYLSSCISTSHAFILIKNSELVGNINSGLVSEILILLFNITDKHLIFEHHVRNGQTEL